jgi:hypothetical protein
VKGHARYLVVREVGKTLSHVRFVQENELILLQRGLDAHASGFAELIEITQSILAQEFEHQEASLTAERFLSVAKRLDLQGVPQWKQCSGRFANSGQNISSGAARLRAGPVASSTVKGKSAISASQKPDYSPTRHGAAGMARLTLSCSSISILKFGRATSFPFFSCWRGLFFRS